MENFIFYAVEYSKLCMEYGKIAPRKYILVFSQCKRLIQNPVKHLMWSALGK